ncbi:hypothetical protein FQZ97_863500 [compost metagenome]
MDAQLMRTASVRLQGDECLLFSCGNCLVYSECRLAFWVNSECTRRRRVTTNRQVEFCCCYFWHPTEDGGICFLRTTITKLLLKHRCGCVVARTDHDATRVSVETMHDTRAI